MLLVEAVYQIERIINDETIPDDGGSKAVLRVACDQLRQQFRNFVQM